MEIKIVSAVSSLIASLFIFKSLIAHIGMLAKHTSEVSTSQKIPSQRKYTCIYITLKCLIFLGLLIYSLLSAVCDAALCSNGVFFQKYLLTLLSFKEVAPQITLLLAVLVVVDICTYYDYLGYTDSKYNKENAVQTQFGTMAILVFLAAAVSVSGKQEDFMPYVYLAAFAAIMKAQKTIRSISVKQSKAMIRMSDRPEVHLRILKKNSLALINVYYEVYFLCCIFFIWHLANASLISGSFIRILVPIICAILKASLAMMDMAKAEHVVQSMDG